MQTLDFECPRSTSPTMIPCRHDWIMRMIRILCVGSGLRLLKLPSFRTKGIGIRLLHVVGVLSIIHCVRTLQRVVMQPWAHRRWWWRWQLFLVLRLTLHLILRLMLCILRSVKALVPPVFLSALLLTRCAKVTEFAIRSTFTSVLEHKGAWLALSHVVACRAFCQ